VLDIRQGILHAETAAAAPMGLTGLEVLDGFSAGLPSPLPPA
jgi:hypothetical protein